MYKPNFKSPEFEGIKNESGLFLYDKIMNANLSQDQIEFGKDFLKKMDDKFYERLLKSELIK